MNIRIGELAKMTGCKPVTIRYYEREGLLNATSRTEGNYRVYGAEDFERLRFIRHCRQHGISLSEIRDLLAYNDNPTVSCAWISKLIDKRIADVDTQIRDLMHLKEQLESLRDKCAGDMTTSCGILEELKHCSACRCCQQNKIHSAD